MITMIFFLRIYYESIMNGIECHCRILLLIFLYGNNDKKEAYCGVWNIIVLQDNFIFLYHFLFSIHVLYTFDWLQSDTQTVDLDIRSLVTYIY